MPLPKMSDGDAAEPFIASVKKADSSRLRSADRIAGKGGEDGAYGNGNGTSGGDGGQGGTALVASNVLRPDVSDAARLRDRQPVPDAYRLRVAPDRESIAQSHGGSAETEAAVKAGLEMACRQTNRPTAAGTRGSTAPGTRRTYWAGTGRRRAAMPTRP